MRTRPCIAILATTALAAGAAAPAGAANHPPKWPRTFKFTASTDYQYRDGLLYGGVTAVRIRTPARDPDGHSLRYRWKAKHILSDGSTVRARVRARRLRAKVNRWIDHGELAEVLVTVTATDGHGGRARKRFRLFRDPG